MGRIVGYRDYWNKNRKQNMAHVHDKQRIKMGNKTWPMYMIDKE
jgi:hypothetical protein